MNSNENKIKIINERMKRYWDARADVDVKYFIRSVHEQSEEEFWKSGRDRRDTHILGINTPRYNQIFNKNDPKKMRALDIGCGIGRMLIPISEVFGEVIGIDVSEKMIKLAKKYTKDIPNCKVIKTSGSDLSIFENDSIDFCYSHIVFQHIPEKEIVINYIKEVSRVLKLGCVFRFQIYGDTEWKPKKTDTWHGVHFNSKEIHKIAKDFMFKILEEKNRTKQNYWLTFKSIK